MPDPQDTFASLGIPADIQVAFQKLGVFSLYQWQKECLLSTGVLRGENLVYCAPTSGGKTLIAELCLLKSVLSLRKKAVFILPYVSLVLEKEKHFKKLFGILNRMQVASSKVDVRAYCGGKKQNKSYRGQVMICTIEKANFIFNHLLKKNRMTELGCIILDETHSLGNAMNGYLLEILVTKINFWNSKLRMTSAPIQTIALSATMGNVSELAEWLNAKLYITNFRPTPLKEYIKAGSYIYDIEGNIISSVPSHFLRDGKEDRDGLCFLCEDGLRQGQSILVFCPRKTLCAANSRVLADHFMTDNRNLSIDPRIIDARMKLLNDLLNENPDLDKVLIDSIPQGIAYHHSQLLGSEKEAIESAFRSGVIQILVATTTLAAGVNLPAGRVIILSLMLGKDTLGVINYKQMAGRAGRAGQSTYGESFLVVSNQEKEKAIDLVHKPLPNIISQIDPTFDNGNALLKAIIESVGINMCRTYSDILSFLKHSLFYYQKKDAGFNGVSFDEVAFIAVSILVESGLLNKKERLERNVISDNDFDVSISKLSSAYIKGGIDPDEGAILYDALLCAQDNLILESPLQLLYLIAPISHSLSPNFDRLISIYEKSYRVKSNTHRVIQAIGIDIEKLYLWRMRPPNQNELHGSSGFLRAVGRRYAKLVGGKELRAEESFINCSLFFKCKRLWAAFALQAYLDGYSSTQIAKEYNCAPFDIDVMIHHAKIGSHIIKTICLEMGWSAMAKVIDVIASDLNLDAQKELTELLKIPSMTHKLAKILVQNDIKSIKGLLEEPPQNIVQYIIMSTSFDLQDPRTVLVEFTADTIIPGEAGDNSSEYLTDAKTVKTLGKTPAEESKWRLSQWVTNLLHSAKEYAIKNKLFASSLEAEPPAAMVLPKDTLANVSKKEIVEKESSSDDEESMSISGDSESDDSSVSEIDSEEELMNIDLAQAGEDEPGEEGGDQDFDETHFRKISRYGENVNIDSSCNVIHAITIARPAASAAAPITTTTPSESGLVVSEHLVSGHDLEKFMESLENYGNLNEEVAAAPIKLSASTPVETYSQPLLHTAAKVYSFTPNPTICAMEPVLEMDRNISGLCNLSDGAVITVSPRIVFSKTKPHFIRNSNQFCPNKPADDSQSQPIAMEGILDLRNAQSPEFDETSEGKALDATFDSKIQSHETNRDSRRNSTKGFSPYMNAKALGLVSSCKYSPYLTPFTASKLRSAGKYLYIRDFSDSKEAHMNYNDQSELMKYLPLKEDLPRLTKQDIISQFHIKDIRDASNCREFIAKESESAFVAFELVFRSAPKVVGNLKRTIFRWSELASTCCSKTYNITCSKQDLLLPRVLKYFNPTFRDYENTPYLLSGIVFNFGDVYSYYWSLPLPLPSTTFEEPDDSSTHPTLLGLPRRCKEIICAYVGFSHYAIKSQVIHGYKSTGEIRNSVQRQDSILPLLLLSKSWCSSVQRSLAFEWRKGICLEWKYLQEILSCRRICKVASNIKAKMIALKERDCLVNGAIEDPAVAYSLCSNATTTTSEIDNFESEPAAIISLMELVNSKGQNFCENLRVVETRRGVLIAGFRAMQTLHAMIALEELLIDSGQLELFMHIEMPLVYSVSDAEFNGIEINNAFFNKLRETLRDRQRVIDMHVKQYLGSNFNIDSREDVSRLKKQLTAAFQSSTAENVDVKTERDSVVDDKSRSEWSHGKELKRRFRLQADNPDCKKHPFLQIIHEYRSHASLLPLLTSILGSRRLNRVRSIFHTVGSATGRLIITHPPLQQVPKECKTIQTLRLNLHQELSNMDRLETRLDSMNRGFESSIQSEFEWAKVTPLHPGSESLISSPLGIIRKVYNISINNAPASHEELDSASSTIMQLRESAYNSATVVDIWTSFGYKYTDADANRIRQVLIEYPSSGKKIICPADQVFRLNASLEPLGRESGILSACQRSLRNQVDVGVSDALSGDLLSADMLCSATKFEGLYETICVRDGFVSAPGYVLLSADYSQIELRILAHLSEDPDLLNAFRSGEDVFTTIAAAWMKKQRQEEVTVAERGVVKHICYALIYGAGSTVIAKNANISVAEADGLLSDFMSRFPGIRNFISGVKETAMEQGFVRTMLGRKRALSRSSADSSERAVAAEERKAVNTLCQGSAADLIKLAMINIHYRLQDISMQDVNEGNRIVSLGRARSNPGGGLYRRLNDVRLVLQIHDELVYEVREELLAEVAHVVKECMQTAVLLHVPLEVKLFAGKSWGVMQSLSFEHLDLSQQESERRLSIGSQPAGRESPSSASILAVSEVQQTIHVQQNQLMKSEIGAKQIVKNLFGNE